MRSMFFGASAFNQPLEWNTSNVTDMNHMFFLAENFSAQYVYPFLLHGGADVLSDID